MESNFLLIEADCIDTSLVLVNSDFKELPSTIYDEEQAEPLKILINTIDKTFFWLDELALKDGKNTIKTKYKQQIQNINLKQLSSWLMNQPTK